MMTRKTNEPKTRHPREGTMEQTRKMGQRMLSRVRPLEGTVTHKSVRLLKGS